MLTQDHHVCIGVPAFEVFNVRGLSAVHLNVQGDQILAERVTKLGLVL
jgi:hypothetical protein